MITVEPASAGSAIFRRGDLSRFLLQARRAAGLRGRVEVLLTSDAAVAELNRAYRGKNSPTDVLSFPAMRLPGRRAPAAGDLAISVETASRQAQLHGHSLESELKVLLLHGVVHLAGLDHETDSGEMLRMERRLREELGLPASLIERADRAPAARKRPTSNGRGGAAAGATRLKAKAIAKQPSGKARRAK